MDEIDLIEVARRVADGLCGPHERLRVVLLHILAQGQPVSLAQLAAQLGTTPEAVARSLDQVADIERDGAGQIIGWGLSLTPTQHQFRLGETVLSTWCAFDTLMYPAILGCTAAVTSICPITGGTIRMVVHPDDLAELDPPGAIISLVLPTHTPWTSTRAGFCAHGHAFVSAEAAFAWQASAPPSLLLPVATACQCAGRRGTRCARRRRPDGRGSGHSRGVRATR